jgi:ABC-type sugar transport system permease subunit/ABC-type glycerol-3-phosphate transport system substrate-binding protein
MTFGRALCRRTRKVPATVVLSFIAALFAGHLPRTAAAADVINVEFLAWAGVSEWALVDYTLIEQFKKDHPGVIVRQFSSLALPPNLFTATKVMGLAAAAGPDVVVIPSQWYGDYVRSGLIQQVDGLPGEWTGLKTLPAGLKKSILIEGKNWGVVDNITVPVCVYDRDVLAYAGIKESRLPASWDQIAALAGKLTTPTRAGFGMRRKDLSEIWTIMALQAGSDTAKLGKEGRISADLLSSGSIRAAEFLRDWGKKVRDSRGRIAFFDWRDQVSGAQIEGKIAAAIWRSNDLNFMLGSVRYWNKQPFITPVPGAFSPVPLSWRSMDDRMIAMPSYIKDPGRRKLVWEYINAVSSFNPLFDQAAEGIYAGGSGVLNIGKIVRDPAGAPPPGLPAQWVPALRASANELVTLYPWLDYMKLCEIMNPVLEKLVAEGGDAAALMKEAQAKYDSEVLGKGKMSGTGGRSAAVAILVLFGAGLVASLVYLGVLLWSEIQLLKRNPSSGLASREIPLLLVLFLPGVVLSAVFATFPLFYGFKMSLYTNILRDGGVYAGLGNYLDVITSTTTRVALVNTLHFMAWSFVFGFLCPLALAIALSGFRRLQLLARTAFFLPAVANAVVIALMWEQLYSTNGFMNLLAKLLGFPPQDWLGNPRLAMFSTVFAQAWSTLGVSGLIYLAGLSTIPEALYEETVLVGAGLWDRMMTVTLPYLRPLIGVSFVGWLLSATRTAEHVLLMTSGGPGQATYVFGLDIFKQAYINIQFGYAMAEVWLLMAVIMVFAIYQMRAIREGQLKVAA